jgi:phosphatidylglycerol:prolipoprotein diacylglycerol transferase
MLDYSFWALVGGIVGSRVLFMLVNWHDYEGHFGEYFSDPGKLLDLLGGGLVFYGGLIGAVLAAVIFTRKRKIDLLRFGDIGLPTVSLGQCFGRLGCFSAGCCWGDVSKPAFPFAVHFPGAQMAKDLFGRVANTASLAFQSQAQDARWVVPSTGQLFHDAVPGSVRVSQWAAEHGFTLPLHPTQLYESIGQLGIFLGMLFLRRYRRFHGQIFGMWLMAYATLRTTVELFRGDLERGTLHGLLSSMGLSGLALKVPPEAWYNISTSELISLCMFLGGATLIYVRAKKRFGGSKSPALPAGVTA